jgi:thioredoxin reductase (NADPH)
MQDCWDLVISGAGPAGLTAGIYSARSGLKTLIIEEAIPGGCVNEASFIENYPGFPNGITGQELARKMMEQCDNAGAEIHSIEKVNNILLKDGKKIIETDKKNYCSNAVIIATGTKYRRLGLKSEEKYKGRGISYCAVCDGPLFKDKKVIVIGGGNCAAIDSIYLSNLASNVKMIHRRSELRSEHALVEEMKKRDIEILFNTEVKKFEGDHKLRSVILYDNKLKNYSKMEVDGAFIDIGRIPNVDFLKNTGVKIENNYIVVDQRQRTNIEGIYAVGDVTKGPYKQVGKAIGDAVVAASEAHGYIENPYYYKE